jgi:hypothetical protein
MAALEPDGDASPLAYLPDLSIELATVHGLQS